MQPAGPQGRWSVVNWNRQSWAGVAYSPGVDRAASPGIEVASSSEIIGSYVCGMEGNTLSEIAGPSLAVVDRSQPPVSPGVAPTRRELRLVHTSTGVESNAKAHCQLKGVYTLTAAEPKPWEHVVAEPTNLTHEKRPLATPTAVVYTRKSIPFFFTS